MKHLHFTNHLISCCLYLWSLLPVVTRLVNRRKAALEIVGVHTMELHPYEMLFSDKNYYTAECIFEEGFNLICLYKHSCPSTKKNHWEFCQLMSEQSVDSLSLDVTSGRLKGDSLSADDLTQIF